MFWRLNKIHIWKYYTQRKALHIRQVIYLHDAVGKFSLHDADLTHWFLMRAFSTPWKQKTLWFSDISRG